MTTKPTDYADDAVDVDLDDWIHTNHHHDNNNSGGSTTFVVHDNDDSHATTTTSFLEMTPLNLDHWTRDRNLTTILQVRRSSTHHHHHHDNNYHHYNYYYFQHLMDWCKACATIMAHSHPRLCGMGIVIGILFIVWILVSTIFNPTLTINDFHDIMDFSSIHSTFDLELGQIDHWCLHGGNDACPCEDPLIPTSRSNNDASWWIKTWQLNQQAVQQQQQQQAILLRQENNNNNRHHHDDLLQVVIIGDSLVEEMNGRWMGRTKGIVQLEQLQTLFNQTFANLTVLTLGIAGDTSPNVLWRLIHGEFPSSSSAAAALRPQIVWLALGMNDVGRMSCSEQVVVMGILRVVEEVLHRTTSSTRIVLNSILPMANVIQQQQQQQNEDDDDDDDDDDDEKDDRMDPSTRMMMMEEDDSGNTLTNTTKNKEEDDILNNNNNNNNNDQKMANDVADVLLLLPPWKRHVKQKEEEEEEDHNIINNPLLVTRNHMKKYTILHQRNQLPLWTSIHAINEELKRFCSQQERVDFFDATNIFAQRVQRGTTTTTYMLQSDLISLRGHPTLAGYAAWEKAMVTKIQKMLAEQDEDDKNDDDDDDVTDDDMEMTEQDESEKAANDESNGE